MDYTEILKWLKDNLNEKRYIHTLGTADCAKELAKQFGLNEDKAYLAGLLHDCAKCFPNEELLDIIHKHLDVEECEMLNYKTLHAPVSAYIAETEFGITDKEILSAIRWHTLGRTGHLEEWQPHWTQGGPVDAIKKARYIMDQIDNLNEEWAKRPDKNHPLEKLPCQVKVAIIKGGHHRSSYPASCELSFNIQILPRLYRRFL